MRGLDLSVGRRSGRNPTIRAPSARLADGARRRLPAGMTPDYRQAARRHLGDAEHLLAAGRAQNADQLFGLSAECSLKAVAVALGVRTQPDGSVDRPHRLHADKLWPAMHALLHERAAGRWSALLGTGEAFSDWSVDQSATPTARPPGSPATSAPVSGPRARRTRSRSTWGSDDASLRSSTRAGARLHAR